MAPRYTIVSYNQGSLSVAILMDGLSFTKQCESQEEYTKALNTANRIAMSSNTVAESSDDAVAHGVPMHMAFLHGCERGINDASLHAWAMEENPDAARLKLLNDIRMGV